MAFYMYDITFLVLFSLGVAYFLWKRKKNLKREGLMYLYRTQVGIKFINYVGGKYKKTLRVLSYVAVFCGYLLMISMVYFLYYIMKIYFFSPEIVRLIKIPPLMPLIPYLPSLFKIDFLPPFYFTYWIIAIAVIAIFHEFAHGIFARRYGIKIKTTGFGFLGPFLAAFVEPDEKQMQKKSKFQQITVLSAGTFTNLVLALLFFLLLSGFFALTYSPAGAMFNTYITGAVGINTISMIGGMTVDNPTNQGIIDLINKNNITNDLVLGGNGNSLNFTKITANNKTYFIAVNLLKEQLEENVTNVFLYQNFPAINSGLRGVIIEVDGKEVKTHEDLSLLLENYSPGEEINIKTKADEEILEYKFNLGENPNKIGKPMIGIGYATSQRGGLMARVANFFNFFKKPATYYEPMFNAELIIFIYNLIWWLALINFSVALINMWPVAIFDGGRMFMLTVWAITGSEKFAKTAFKIMTYLILGSLLALMFGWFIAIF